MYISRVVIRNFRSFDILDVPLSPGVTCVLGENNTGKTNFLHALRLVADANLSSRFRELREFDIHSGVDIAKPDQVIVSLEFRDYETSTNEKALIGRCEVEAGLARLSYRFRPITSIREEFDALVETEGGPDEALEALRELTLEDYHYEMTGGGEADPATVSWNEDLGTSIRFGDMQAFKVDYLPALRDVEETLRFSGLSPLTRLLESMDIPREQRDALVDILKKANDDIEGQESIKTVGNAAQSSFAKTAGDAFEMSLRLGMVEPSFASIARALTVLLSDGKLSEFQPERNGLGLNNVLYISLLLEYFERRKTSPAAAGQLLLVEEPEAHLHPQLQRVLYRALSERPVQTILTTHSTYISSAAPLSSFVVLTNPGTAATHAVSPSATAGLSAGEMADLERFLDATRSTLLYARKVILVEGPAELFIIPPLVKAVMGIDLDRHGVAVVPIHGTHFKTYARLFGPSCIRKKCAIIGDIDTSPDDVNWEEEDEDGVYCDLDDLQNDYVAVYQCLCTFERSLTIPGMIEPLRRAALELNKKELAGKLDALKKVKFPTLVKLPDAQRELRAKVLNAAKDTGKARFAQVLSKHVCCVAVPVT